GGHEKVGVVAADRVLDRSAVRWISDGRATGGRLDGRGPGVWSPDGGRVFFGSFSSVKAQPGPVQRVEVHGLVVDVRTLARREVTLTSAQTGSAAGTVVFGPGGRGFAVAPFEQIHPPAQGIGNLALFDEDGHLTGQVRIGPAAVPDQPFSPDGRLVAVHVGGSPTLYVGGSTRVLDIATGTEVGRAEGDVVGWVDDDHYAVRVGGSVRLVELGSGRVVAEKALAPAGRELTGVWLRPLVGPAPAGAVVL
ncbi:MAG TPA: hypothetical protein VLM05_19740, partial [Mycobacteriales bacterium]|nr:hypothetical protein [Mycobacteriales bacterium]